MAKTCLWLILRQLYVTSFSCSSVVHSITHDPASTDNSAVFYIGANNDYDMCVVEVGTADYKTISEDQPPGTYDKITNDKWIAMYDTPFVSYGNVILAVDEYRSEIINTTGTGKPDNWPNVDSAIADEWAKGAVSWAMSGNITKILSDRSSIRQITATGAISKNWITTVGVLSRNVMKENANSPKFAHVAHVFVERIAATSSRIQVSLTFMLIVITCNFVKILTMLWVVFMERKHYIVTLGDGIASFIEHRDHTTDRMCMYTKPDIKHAVSVAKFQHDDELQTVITTAKTTWNKQFITYSNAMNRDREVGTYLLYVPHDHAQLRIQLTMNRLFVNIALAVLFLVVLLHSSISKK